MINTYLCKLGDQGAYSQEVMVHIVVYIKFSRACVKKIDEFC